MTLVVLALLVLPRAVAFALAAVAACDGHLNAFVAVDAEGAMAAAKAADACIARGEAGPLTGIPMAHKDLFCTNGVKTTAASRMLDNFIPPYDAAVVERLAAAGAVSIGKTNMDEFAMGSSNETSYYGPVKNPWDKTRVPGGSSGGSAVAVAARLVPYATGTDTGGSIPQPPARRGVTGLKPTYGRVSRYGVIALAESLDHVGPMTRSAADAGLVLQGIAGHDLQDPTSFSDPGPGIVQSVGGGSGVRAACRAAAPADNGAGRLTTVDCAGAAFAPAREQVLGRAGVAATAGARRRRWPRVGGGAGCGSAACRRREGRAPTGRRSATWVASCAGA